ncbi:MAG TPA: ArsA-related P-loop ATPase [Solirubrobacteraceae bacterium]|nr:ArsA-related P-loop ATPase [Solirubrobacteraceae bacterium]
MSQLLDHRLIFVTGKGGVGKTTVSLALGLAGSRRGLRTIVADMNGEGDTAERELAPGLFQTSVDPQSAMEEYLAMRVPAPAAALLRNSRLFQVFAMAAPGLREMLCVGKFWDLAQSERRTSGGGPYDLVIVDAPASGHGAAILRTPRTIAEIARVGPVAHHARTIAETLLDRDFTAIVAVCTAEEMPVNETFELRDALASAPEPLELEQVILNARYPDRFAPADLARLEAARAGAGDGAAAIDTALAEAARAAQQAEQEARLREAFPDRLHVLPVLFEPRLGLAEIGRLAGELAA